MDFGSQYTKTVAAVLHSLTGIGWQLDPIVKLPFRDTKAGLILVGCWPIPEEQADTLPE